MFASPCAEWDREQSVLSLNRDGPCNSAAAVVLHSMLIALLAWTAGAYALTPEHRPDSGSRNKEETGGSRDVMQWTAHPELSASPEAVELVPAGVEGWSDVCASPELAPASPHITRPLSECSSSGVSGHTMNCGDLTCQKCPRVGTASYCQPLARFAFAEFVGENWRSNVHWFPSPHRGSRVAAGSSAGRGDHESRSLSGPRRWRNSRSNGAPPTGPTHEPQPQVLW